MQNQKQKILLLTCCAPCSTHVIEVLKASYDITALFYNPNIQPEEEYLRRLKAMEKLCTINNMLLLRGQYATKKWMERVGGLEKEPEGGKRCAACFSMRLEEAVRVALDQGLKTFAATLTISPHKNVHVINRAGQEVEKKFGVRFLAVDFKQDDGFRKSCEMSRHYGLYRQHYCGCIYSKRDSS